MIFINMYRFSSDGNHNKKLKLNPYESFEKEDKLLWKAINEQ